MTLRANNSGAALRIASTGATILEARSLRTYVGTDGQTWPMTYADEFTSLRLLADNENGLGWYPRYAASGPDTGGGYWPVIRDGGGAYVWGGFSTLGGEFEQFVDPRVPELAAYTPFTANPTSLTVSIRNTPPALVHLPDQWQPFTSGCLISYLNGHGFAQQYGYFEFRMRLPLGFGMWSGLWLLATNGYWPPEIDIMERFSGYPPNYIAMTAHTRRPTTGYINGGPLYDYGTVPYGNHWSDFNPAFVADTSDGFHTYGVEWTPTTITWFFDRQVAAVASTPDDMHQKMYLLIDFAADFTTLTWTDNIPLQAEIDWVRCWAMPR